MYNPDDKRDPFPNLRKMKRTCNNELYRARKRLKVWIPPEVVAEGEKLYFQKVASNLIWIVENNKNRKKLADWWENEVAPDLSKLWNVNEKQLAQAFRDSFGG